MNSYIYMSEMKFEKKKKKKKNPFLFKMAAKTFFVTLPKMLIYAY